jgi:hypothetical protein
MTETRAQAERARQAYFKLQTMDRTAMLHDIADALRSHADTIFAANATNIQAQVLPVLNVSGGVPFSANPNTSLDKVNSRNASLTIKDNVVYHVSKHNLKFGVFFLDWHSYGYNGGNPPQGSYTFNGTGAFTTGNGLADMYLGRITSCSEATGVVGGVPEGGWGTYRGRMKNFETYFRMTGMSPAGLL